MPSLEFIFDERTVPVRDSQDAGCILVGFPYILVVLLSQFDSTARDDLLGRFQY